MQLRVQCFLLYIQNIYVLCWGDFHRHVSSQCESCILIKFNIICSFGHPPRVPNAYIICMHHLVFIYLVFPSAINAWRCDLGNHTSHNWTFVLLTRVHSVAIFVWMVLWNKIKNFMSTTSNHLVKSQNDVQLVISGVHWHNLYVLSLSKKFFHCCFHIIFWPIFMLPQLKICSLVQTFTVCVQTILFIWTSNIFILYVLVVCMPIYVVLVSFFIFGSLNVYFIFKHSWFCCVC